MLVWIIVDHIMLLVGLNNVEDILRPFGLSLEVLYCQKESCDNHINCLRDASCKDWE